MKILVVDDHPLVREALRDHVRQLEQGVEVYEARSSHEALAAAQLHPDLDLVLLDLNLPDANGFSALTALRERHPAIPVVVLSGNDERHIVFEALDKGAMGFVPKTATTQVMLSALRLVLSGGTYVPAEAFTLHPADAGAHLPLSAIDTIAGRRPRRPADLGMTPRQAEILALLLQGKPNKIISRELGLAESTVKIHITSILRALNVTTRVQAVIAVTRLGLQLDTAGVSAKSTGTR
jgi:DNA-binding NarL/FixJ family response regulator